jgi:hypothetical protein
MPLEYEASGRVRVNGCAGISYARNYLTEYSVGDRVWVRKKASLGRFESVVIKRVRVGSAGNPSYGGSETVVVYTDTFNRVWMERELVSLQEAEALVSSYNSMVSAKTREMYDRGACLPIKPEGCD